MAMCGGHQASSSTLPAQGLSDQGPSISISLHAVDPSTGYSTPSPPGMIPKHCWVWPKNKPKQVSDWSHSSFDSTSLGSLSITFILTKPLAGVWMKDHINLFVKVCLHISILLWKVNISNLALKSTPQYNFSLSTILLQKKTLFKRRGPW